jgi:hypothetical protein
MNLLLSKKERNAFDEALPAALIGRTEQKLGELRLSSTHTQSWPFLNGANQLGAKVVQFALKPITEYEFTKPAIAKQVLAAMAGDPDPVTTLSDIRKLLVGPTHKLHDAMFEEVITILEESDREVQDALQSLESRCVQLSHITNELVSSSVEDKDQNRIQIELLQKELQRSAAAQQDMLSEMFLAIDAKIGELAAQVNRKVEGLSTRIEADMRVAAANQERDMQHLEANCLAISREAAGLLENRLAHLENKAARAKDDLREVFADGLASLADRLKALRAAR